MTIILFMQTEGNRFAKLAAAPKFYDAAAQPVLEKNGLRSQK